MEAEAVARNCRKTFMKELSSELSDDKLQDKFDRNAERKLEELEKLVTSISSFVG
jgi:ribosome recycling factor